MGVPRFACAITAGGRVGGAFAEAIRTDVKALAPIGDRLLIDAALEAARAAGASRIAVVGGGAVHAHCSRRVDDDIDEAASGSGEENLLRALAYAGDAPLLLLTSDLPFVTGADLSEFIARAHNVDGAMPLAAEAAYDAMFPGAPRHVVALAGERIANGSVFWLGPGVAARIGEVATRLFAARKSLLRMALLLGPALLPRFLTGRLRISDVENRAHALFGLTVRAVRDASPTMCYDVDTQADYSYALERLARG